VATKETNYVGVTNAADTNILATMFARGFQIEESADGSAAGLQITWPDGTVCKYANGDEPLSSGNVTGYGAGPLVGAPAQASSFPGGTGPAATIYCKVRSLGANTNVRCTEFS
jgi:hypothetical protein